VSPNSGPWRLGLSVRLSTGGRRLRARTTARMRMATPIRAPTAVPAMAPGDRLDEDDDGVGLGVEVLVLLPLTPIPVPVRLGLTGELPPVLLPAAPPDEDGVPLSVTGASGGGVDDVVAGCAVETLELVLLVDGQVAVEGTVTPTERHCYIMPVVSMHAPSCQGLERGGAHRR